MSNSITVETVGMCKSNAVVDTNEATTLRITTPDGHVFFVSTSSDKAGLIISAGDNFGSLLVIRPIATNMVALETTK